MDKHDLDTLLIGCSQFFVKYVIHRCLDPLSFGGDT